MGLDFVLAMDDAVFWLLEVVGAVGGHVLDVIV